MTVTLLTAKGVTVMPLTDSAIRNAKPKEKNYKLADGGGLYLLITPKGGKWWRLDYRFNGKRKTLSMGVYPDVSLKSAREWWGKHEPNWSQTHSLSTAIKN
jgi:hypothetical protein